MLRDSSLIPLSRQHHNGLALCVLSRRALAENPSAECVAKVARRVIDYYELELANHFKTEEQVLFPVCEPMPVVDDLRAEHRMLEKHIEQLRTAPAPDVLERFFTLLTAHIRREERELFEEIQRVLPRDVLNQAGAEIERVLVKVCLPPQSFTS